MAFLPKARGACWARQSRVSRNQPMSTTAITPFHIVFALYPRITQLDFTGPFEVLSRLPGARCVLASVEGGELAADRGLKFAGLVRLADIDECTLLCVPGGYGTVSAIEDPAYLDALRRLGARARFVTS